MGWLARALPGRFPGPLDYAAKRASSGPLPRRGVRRTSWTTIRRPAPSEVRGR